MSDRILDQLRLRDLGLLEQVAALGTLREVAAQLHVTQPAVTQMLQALERAFGVALVERGRRGVSLTPAGESALARLRCARQEVDQAVAAARDQGRPLLRVGATPIGALALLPRAVGRLQKRLPQARVVLAEAGVAALWRQLQDGVIDALVGRLPGPAAPGLRHQSVGQERMVVAARAAHPLLRGAAPRGARAWQAALARAAWVLPPQEAMPTQSLREWMAQASEALPPAMVESGSFHAAMGMAARADLLVVVPESALRAFGAALGLAAVPAPWPRPPVDIVFATRESHWDDPAMALLRDCFAPARAGRAR